MSHVVPGGVGELKARFDAARAGVELYETVRELYPFCRSLTGPGNRATLATLRRIVDLTIEEVPSGTPAFDWVVPPEWNIRDAWIKDPAGRKIVDFGASNLHVVGYSAPVRGVMPLDELRERLFSLPEHPDWIPYRTSYYRETWGFCVTHRLLESLRPGRYEVCIDSSLAPGSLSYGECVLPGESDDEVLISCHICHPSLCNDNLSGVAVASHLARLLAGVSRRHTFRFLFIPGTIGSIVWLARNAGGAARRIRHGLVLSCLGDDGAPTYKKSRRGDAPIDRAVRLALRDGAPRHAVTEFSPYGYDERQYCSPGFNLPVGLLTRSPHGTFAAYHTSADDLDFVKPAALADSLRLLLDVMEIVEGDGTYVNLNPLCEPQLGRRGLYDELGGANERQARQLALLWVLNQSDGGHSLLDIAEKSGMEFGTIHRAAARLAACGLLEPARAEMRMEQSDEAI